MALFAAASVWTFVVGSRGHPWPVAGIVAASAAALALARALTRVSRVIVPIAVLVIAAGVAAIAGDELFSKRPLSGPFGYVNAMGAFFMLAATAGLMLAASARSRGARLAGIAGAIAAASVPVASHVAASTALLIAIPVPVAILASRGPNTARLMVVLCGALFAVAVIGTAALGGIGRSTGAGLESVAASIFTPTRLELWNDAEEMIAREPLRGIGPGRFGAEVSTSRRDRGNRLFWAQNDVLQQGAEQGLPGALLLLGLFAWGFVALGARTSVDVTAALAAAALAAAGIQACEDFVLHFPAVSMTVAALVGVGMAAPRDAAALEGEAGT